MEYTVEGEDISPEEYNDQKLWSRAVKAHDHLFAKKKSVDTTASPPGGTENGQGKNAKKETQKRVNYPIKRRQPLPRLPMSDYKIIYRPGGGLDLRPVNGGMLLQTVCRCADVDFAIARTQDKLRINPFNNSFTISTPSEERMKRYVKLQELQIKDQQHPLRAYVAAPDDAIKGIIYNAVYDQTQDEIFEDIINLNKSRNYTIADARQLGKTKSLLITFIGTKEVPREIIFFGSIYTCYPFKAKVETCFNCRRAGHRADVCPKEKTGLCRRCGGQHPVKEQPDCTPKCILCNGDHFTGTRKCKQRFERPGNFKGRTSTSTENPWQRGQQQQGQASGEHRQSRSQFRSNSRTGRRHSRSRSNSFPPLRRSESKERPNQVSWKPQDSQLEKENAELRAQIRRQEKEMKEIKEMLQNLLSVRTGRLPLQSKPRLHQGKIFRYPLPRHPREPRHRSAVPQSKGKQLR
ncbi:hypothetical protein HPB48_017276 [Haemaphysalis longicornis]|uniref:CCHC-type domain-containing protein n=1 Tax=Haemaphysalis longicornis TaxID=44386 RepID=A0A9J6FUX5_HAELO|nr:hypothetical protein HPB48_017276 [Haemaphysalis longicornis]